MTTINAENLQTFNAFGAQWWDAHGPFKPLHDLNPVRLEFIVGHIKQTFGLVSDLKILDVGCGGGLVCEPLARLGAKVTGYDASSQAIEAARAHSTTMGLSIDYQQGTVDDLTEYSQYDVVLALEVAEHVENVQHFFESCFRALKPGGLLFVSTLNRTLKSYALGIIAAEYLLRWVPRGTHEWAKFLKPSEVEKFLNMNGSAFKELRGISYNPLIKEWSLSKDFSVNYIGVCEKPLG